MILKWDEQLLSTIRAYPAPTGPTITARALGVLHTATYDAWAAYDPTAKVTRPDGSRSSSPASPNTPANKKEAISYAAYRVLNDLFPSAGRSAPPVPALYGPTLPALGRAPRRAPTAGQHRRPRGHRPPRPPRRVGNLAAQGRAGLPATTTAQPPRQRPQRRHDSLLSRRGQEHLGQRRPPLALAAAVRPPPPCPPTRGQPCPGRPVQKPATPQWGKVKMFGPTPRPSFRVNGPPKNPDGTYSTADLPIAIEDAANLTDAEKATAEYWADGPKSEFPPGHTALFAQAISRKKGHTLDTDVKMFFSRRERDAGRRRRGLVPEVQVRLGAQRHRSSATSTRTR